ncbi:SPOR domain-containing protein [Amantichitinum ursilacus]|uniref:Cell division protein DedD n=1 Tax=Amantichitinum ursilacus TaxID=857265 RepID=A0A0N0XJZ3_9NEIS|nr:SPOR domain-containing protein [Amantichitinum ursilacus]KPC52758.1 cell division protein DedD [Amantichitinum ursilacus]
MARDNVPEELQYLRKRARRRLVGAIALVVFSLTVLWTVLDSQPPTNLVSQHAVEIIASAPSSGVASQVVIANDGVDAGMDASAAAVAPQPVLVPAGSAPAAVPPPAVVAHNSEPTHASTLLPGKLVRPGADDEDAHTPKPTPAKGAVAKPKPTPTPKPAVKDVKDTVKDSKPAANDPERILNGMDDATSAKKDDNSPRHYVQLGAFGDAEKARQTVSKLKAAGMPAYAEKVTTSNGTLTRVRVGPILANEAYAINKKLGALGYQGQVVSK